MRIGGIPSQRFSRVCVLPNVRREKDKGGPRGTELARTVFRHEATYLAVIYENIVATGTAYLFLQR